jgi:hypothetical protein
LNIIDALHSRDFLAPLFRDPATWAAWEIRVNPILVTKMLKDIRPDKIYFFSTQ